MFKIEEEKKEKMQSMKIFQNKTYLLLGEPS